MDSAVSLIHLGLLLLVGLGADLVGRRTHLPRVTLLILVGVLFGPSGLDLITVAARDWLPFIADMALAMIGFLLGGKLTRDLLLRAGPLVLWLSLVEVLVTLALVTLGLYWFGLSLSLALLFGAVATATDPAACRDVIVEFDARGRFTEVLEGIVAIDDAWGLIVFSLVLVAVQIIDRNQFDAALLLHAGWELGGAVLIGVCIGLPMVFLSGRVAGDNPLLLEVAGSVLLCAGLALWLEVSYLLACVVLGAVLANFNGHRVKPFKTLENIEDPVVVLFFILSGASLSLEQLRGLEWVAVAFIGWRAAARIAGGWLGAMPRWVDARMARWIGFAMQPQAGVALAMAFLVLQLLPEYGETVLPVVIAATVAFELLGPLAVRESLRRVGEIPR